MHGQQSLGIHGAAFGNDSSDLVASVEGAETLSELREERERLSRASARKLGDWLSKP
jgi:hypothetical protein